MRNNELQAGDALAIAHQNIMLQKQSNPILYQPLKSVNRHWLCEQFYHFVIPCEPEQSLCNIIVLLRIYIFIYFNSIIFRKS